MALTEPTPGSNRAGPRPAILQQDLTIRLLFLTVGFTPIATLAASLLDVVPLHSAAPVSISLAIAAGVFAASTNPSYRWPVARGFLAGLVAVLIYDCTRLPFVVFGGWPDFIPNIGVWLRNDPETHWVVGYLWRYLGNGAGMGLAFFLTVPLVVRRIDPRRAGVLFGLAVWSGLMLVLLTAPNGQTKMFALTPATFVLSLLGHVVYGGVLGLIANRSRSPAAHNLQAAKRPVPASLQ